jgi:D-cysteine desulfhydrase family pyridoxal phosphate-dependent enzyme
MTVLRHLPRLRFAQLPTPVHHLPRLSSLLGRSIWIKRDDQTGLALGGNKTRKLELLVADAVGAGADTLITGGAPQSNHCRQTAAAAAHTGLRCTVVLAGHPPAGPTTGNLLLDQLLGAEIVWSGDRPRDEVMQEVCDRRRAEGGRPYLIPYGGSNALGAAAYALAMEELVTQGCDADLVVVASSSGGTQAGLCAGKAICGFAGGIYGISIDQPGPELREHVATLAREVASALDAELALRPGDITADDRFLGRGYGVLGALEREAIHLFARTEGILLDPVYTGRAAGAMVQLIRGGELPGKKVLFWHTGGAPALFAYARELIA